MKELSIFIDESGDFGGYAKHSPFSHTKLSCVNNYLYNTLFSFVENNCVKRKYRI